jgi:hypothetical protein
MFSFYVDIYYNVNNVETTKQGRLWAKTFQYRVRHPAKGLCNLEHFWSKIRSMDSEVIYIDIYDYEVMYIPHM